jgi:hypothetical protein
VLACGNDWEELLAQLGSLPRSASAAADLVEESILPIDL